MMSAALYRTKMEPFLAAMPQRDRTALLGLSLFLGVLLLIYGVFVPVIDFKTQARERFAHQQELYVWLDSQRNLVAASSIIAPNKPTPKAESPLTLVNSSAKKFELTLKRVQPESNGSLRVWIENANFDDAIKWVEELGEQGLNIKELNIDKQKPGVVNLRLTIST